MKISDLKKLYTEIPKEPVFKHSYSPPNEKLMDKTVEHLNKEPVITKDLK